MSDMQNTPAELKTGDLAPDFTLPATGGKSIRLSDLRGTPVVLFFYPQDNTPTCTTEAKAFSDAASRFVDAGALVFGISPDSIKRHENFKAKHSLQNELIADETHAAIGLYGVWKEKKTFGVIYMGVERSTYIVDAEGRISAVWRKVKVNGHVDEVLSRLHSS